VRELLLVLPRLARMIGGLLLDRGVPRTVKVALAAVAVYLASPIDLIPDLLPWVGWIDDLLLAAVVVDGLLGYLDRGLLLRYWPGSAESLDRSARVAARLARWVPSRVKRRIFGG
jgi:uncharacterized membrane protein YkvA (DUF1232 family)